jgi:hypothetical protein
MILAYLLPYLGVRGIWPSGGMVIWSSQTGQGRILHNDANDKSH